MSTGRMSLEFTRDLKTKVSMKLEPEGELTPNPVDGSYSVDGETLTLYSKGPGGKEISKKVKIVTLTHTDFKIEIDDDGKTRIDEFKRKKD